MKKIDWGDVVMKVFFAVVTAVMMFIAVKYYAFGTVVEIDGCEYIRSGFVHTHKGNCKYCKERIEQ